MDRPIVNNPLPDRVTPFDGLAQLAEARRQTRATDTAQPSETCQRAETAPSARGASIARDAAPFQFRLRTMLWLMVPAGGLFAVKQFIPAGWWAVLVWFLVLVLAHVTANFWGTRIAPGAGQRSLDEEGVDQRSPQHRREVHAAIGAVRLSESARPGWPMFFFTAAGALTGGTLGGVSLFLLSLPQAGYTGVIVGTLSAAILGGFLGFLTSTFAEIALRAWNEALCGAASQPSRERMSEDGIPRPSSRGNDSPGRPSSSSSWA